MNTKYWKNLQEEPTLRRRRGRRWREGPTWSWRAMQSRAPEPQSSFSQHSKSWLFLHLNSSTSALFNGIHRPQFLWEIWHSSLFFNSAVPNNTCKRRSSNSWPVHNDSFIWFDDSASYKNVTWRAQVSCAVFTCVSRSSSTQPPLVRLRFTHTVRPPPTQPSGLSEVPLPPAFLDALLHHC